MEWIAYCTFCQKEIYKAPNGVFVEAYAQMHIKANSGHDVIVGYVVGKEAEGHSENHAPQV